MKVTTVSANVRYSKVQADGAWKSIELSAEASLNAKEEWQEAQAELYSQLGQQLKTLWSNGGAKVESPDPPQERPHWCPEHQDEFKAKTGPHGEFYSHRINGTNGWCNEPRAAG